MELTEEKVLEALKNVIDPEIGIDVVNLGLIYSVDIKEGDVAVKMTMTTPGCPLYATLTQNAENVIKSLEGVKSAKVDLVWDPPWRPEMMSDEAKQKLGYY